MSVLIAAVVLVGLLCTVDLVLSVGVIKRLREHTEILSNRASMDDGPPVIPVGEEVGPFSSSTVDGEPLSRETMLGDTLVAFFSPTCKPCKEQLPKFVRYALTLPDGRDQVLAVVVGDAGAAAATVAELSPVAQVVVEDHAGPLSTAFRAEAYPTVLMVAPDGTGRPVVTANQVELDEPAVVSAGTGR